MFEFDEQLLIHRHVTPILARVEGKKMHLISVGPAGVWGVDLDGQVHYREGTRNDLDLDGTSWIEVDEEKVSKNAQIKTIFSGHDIVFVTLSVSIDGLTFNQLVLLHP